jgi:hypothetical protein
VSDAADPETLTGRLAHASATVRPTVDDRIGEHRSSGDRFGPFPGDTSADTPVVAARDAGTLDLAVGVDAVADSPERVRSPDGRAAGLAV